MKRRSFIKSMALAVGFTALSLGMIARPKREEPVFDPSFYNGKTIMVYPDGTLYTITEYEGSSSGSKLNPDWVKAPREEVVIHWGRTRDCSADHT